MERLKELVKIEADNLRRFATEEELDSLDFSNLDSSDIHHCIYGQMTGNCLNKRALELIESCCETVYERKSEILGIRRVYNKECGIIKNIYSDDRLAYYMSPIEKFILIPFNHGNTIALINYLKGEAKELIFS